jgi:ubiquinone/menaquinone biosynthesis C-methylase UbiE
MRITFLKDSRNFSTTILTNTLIGFCYYLSDILKFIKTDLRKIHYAKISLCENKRKEINLANKRIKMKKTVMFMNKNRTKGLRRWILDYLLEISRRHLLNITDSFVSQESLVIDIGCNIGYLTQPLSMRTTTVGLDIQKPQIRSAKKCNRRIDFICCDVCALPLKQSSINIAVCGSVLEHVENLEGALKEIQFVLEKKGKIVAGYQIETELLQSFIRTFWRSEALVWSQKKIVTRKGLLQEPDVHKKSYLEIRKGIETHFSPLIRKKIPNNFFPDLFSIYECFAGEK